LTSAAQTRVARSLGGGRVASAEWTARIGLTPEHERPAEIPRLGIRVPYGSEFSIVPFEKATTTDLERAIALASGKPTAHDDVHQKSAKKLSSVLQAIVAAPKGTRRHAPVVRVHVTDDKHLRIDVIGIDQDDLARVARALGAHAKSSAN
jgi:hypothetical protein